MQRSLTYLLSPRHRAAWRWLLLALVLVVAWFAFSPTSGVDAFENVDKVKHVLAFSCLATTASLGWTAAASARGSVALSLLLYGAFIEVVQTAIPGRSASWFDLGADAVGIAGGLLAVLLARRYLDRPDA